jgi:DNA-binding winged helix-turn-helix (wHTH) protein
MKWLSLILLMAVSFIALAVYNGKKESPSAYSETKELIVLRKVVHEVLLTAGDSTHRVLPVKQISENEFHLFPEKPLSIEPDSFVNIVNRNIHEGKLPRNFTATVVNCQDKETVWGFAASPVTEENTVACLGRTLPKDCYYFSFIFSPEEKSFLKGSYFYFGIAALTLLGLFFVWKNKKAVAKEKILVVPEAIAAEEYKVKAHHIQIGKYLFNAEQQYLELAGEKTALTIKECKVLFILANAPNKIVEREMLQKEVWENEGVIVTRSLDMFISKLRKKLTEDANVKIVNVHGKGYKLDINS